MTDSYFKDFDWKRVAKDAVSLFSAMAVRIEAIPTIDTENLKKAGVYGLSKYAYWMLKNKFAPEAGKTGDYAGLTNYGMQVIGTNIIYIYALDWTTGISLSFKQALPDTAIAVPIGGLLNNDWTISAY